MMLNLKVCKNIITLENTTDIITSGNVNTVVCNFDFDENWKDYSITAIFSTLETCVRSLIDKNAVIIPCEILASAGKFTIGVYGTKMESGKLIERYTSNLVHMQVEKGSYTEATDADVPSADVWERYIAEVKALQEDAKNSAELARESATNAIESATNANNSAINSAESANIALQAKKDINNVKLEIDSTKQEIDSTAKEVSADKEIVVQAKDTVLNTLEQEQKKSDVKYAGALKAEVTKQKNIKIDTDASYLQNVKLNGESVQNGEPNLNNAVDIENVQDTVTIDVVDYNNTDTQHVELVLNRTYAEGDYIDVDTMQDVQNRARMTLNGSESWVVGAHPTQLKTKAFATTLITNVDSNNLNCMCNKLKAYTANQLWGTDVAGVAQSRSQIIIRIPAELNITTVEQLKIWLASNNLEVEYTLANPIIIKLNEVLTEQEITALQNLKTYNNITNISSAMPIGCVYNKSLSTLEKRIADLEALISTPSTASLLLENMAKDNESEVM